MKKPIKFCKNPECLDEIVDYKSSKREYCSDYCRNHHGHKRRTEENQEFLTYQKGLVANYKVLKLHSDNGIYIETLYKYERFGFNTKYLPEVKIFVIAGKKTNCYQIKDIVFSLDPTNDNIIIYKQKVNK